MPVARSNGHKIHYETFGDGPVIVLHPGMYQLGSHWSRTGYTPAVQAARRTVVEVDPLGLGMSDAPHNREAYVLERRVSDVLAILDDLGAETASFWGYSMGAWVGYGMAERAPQRLTALVAGGWDPVRGFQSAYEAAVQQLGLPRDTDGFELLRQYASAGSDTAEVVACGDIEAHRAAHDAFAGEQRSDGGLARARFPILMYCGTADPWHDPMRAVANRSGARFVAIPRADHATAFSAQRDEVLRHVLPFLDGK